MSEVIETCHVEVKEVKIPKTTKEWLKDPRLYTVRRSEFANADIFITFAKFRMVNDEPLLAFLFSGL